MKKLCACAALVLIAHTGVSAKDFDIGISPMGSLYLSPFFAQEETVFGFGIAVDVYYIIPMDPVNVCIGAELGFLRYYSVHVPDDPTTPTVFFSDMSRNALYIEAALRAELTGFYLCVTLGAVLNFISDTFTIDAAVTDNSTMILGWSISAGLGYLFNLDSVLLDLGARFRLINRYEGYDKLITLNVGVRFPL